MATYEVRFSGCIHVEDESSEESAIEYVRKFIINSAELEYEAEKIGEDDDE